MAKRIMIALVIGGGSALFCIVVAQLFGFESSTAIIGGAIGGSMGFFLSHGIKKNGNG